jgi:hypothetical protein
MNAADRRKWRLKTERLNQGVTLKRGMVVQDSVGARGVVVRIDAPDKPTIEDHGFVYVWQDTRTGWGADNCEHYAFYDWNVELRIIDAN